MLVEFIKSDTQTLMDQINGWDYRIYAQGSDLLCIPAELEAQIFAS